MPPTQRHDRRVAQKSKRRTDPRSSGATTRSGSRAASSNRPRSSAPEAIDAGLQVYVDHSLYDLLLHPDLGPLITVPGVAGDEQHAAIPDQQVPFRGLAVAYEVVLREQNGLIRVADGAQVRKAARYAIAVNGATIYMPRTAAQTVEQLLIEAQHALGKLRTHPVAWWIESSWLGRAVYYQGVPARIAMFESASGTCTLIAEDGWQFAVPGHLLELDSGAQPQTYASVDILSDEVWWTRLRPADELAPTHASMSNEEAKPDQPDQEVAS